MRNPICWWFGCDPDYLAGVYGQNTPCKRCGVHDVDYADQVGDTLHNAAVVACKYWLWRKWWPAKCDDCGKRYGRHDGCDDIPF